MGAQLKLAACVTGIYATFLTWSLVHEPLTTREWPNSQARFQAPCVMGLVQAAVAATAGALYLRHAKTGYSMREFWRGSYKDLLAISFTQSVSSPLATYALGYVDFLTYMLAKSCKLIPILVVHLMLYRTEIARDKKIVAVAVTVGVVIFNVGSAGPAAKVSRGDSVSLIYGFLPLALSLLLDGFTNATQDTMLKRNRAQQGSKPITGGHLMLGLNICIVLWNLLYLAVCDRQQIRGAKALIAQDPHVAAYLLTYAACGALGQICIFYTLQNYGSLVLVMVTVTRKMVSLILSIAVYSHHVTKLQWLGIFIVFGGITGEAALKRQTAVREKSD
ncbi:LADA_0F12926g1_1 [Lachancea dasiensis]|uniref:UDP-galactose transporter homolog 1 n=1 Tax=Lachancea dasiensis TaxID=1072105 RepID=A0A1G4JMN4_9SACH|nr:LADA_0F12926g1_1 [Lachancea dasiensis]